MGLVSFGPKSVADRLDEVQSRCVSRLQAARTVQQRRVARRVKQGGDASKISDERVRFISKGVMIPR